MKSRRRDIPARADLAFDSCIQFAIQRLNDRQSLHRTSAAKPDFSVGKHANRFGKARTALL
jgi:hypothetical protein